MTMHLNLFIHSRGHHEASWRHPGSSPLSVFDIRYYQDLARKAEAGLFDSIFLADQLALQARAAEPNNIPLHRCTDGIFQFSGCFHGWHGLVQIVHPLEAVQLAEQVRVV